MQENDKIFNVGVSALVLIVVLIAILQVCFRTQNKARARVRQEIVDVQKSLAEADALFASLVREDYLRGITKSMYPDFAPIGFNKTASITDIEFITDLDQ